MWIEVKYANQLSLSLERFVVKKTNPYLAYFRCPICGDSKKSKTRTRGVFYTKHNKLFFMCHNCGASTTFSKFLKQMYPSIYNDYALEKYKEGATKTTKEIEFQNFTPFFEEKSALDRIFSKLSELPVSNPGVRYCKRRMIPEEKLNSIYFTFETSKLFELCPDHEEIKNMTEPRIIFPFHDKQGKLVGVNARAIDSNPLRYLTLKIDKHADLIYNINKINISSRVYCVEGPIDSLFLPNCVAVGSSDLSRVSRYLSKDNTTLVFDNQPRNLQLVKTIRKLQDDNWSVVIWPDTIKEKDINEMIINGMSSNQILDTINKNTYSGLKLRVKVNAWSKC